MFRRAILEIDFSVVCGHRGEFEQNDAFMHGYSKLMFPNSSHNTYPSDAVDVIPFPSRYVDIGEFVKLSNVIKRIADEENVSLEWGGSWTKFKDYPHWQRRKDATG